MLWHTPRFGQIGQNDYEWCNSYFNSRRNLKSVKLKVYEMIVDKVNSQRNDFRQNECNKMNSRRNNRRRNIQSKKWSVDEMIVDEMSFDEMNVTKWSSTKWSGTMNNPEQHSGSYYFQDSEHSGTSHFMSAPLSTGICLYFQIQVMALVHICGQSIDGEISWAIQESQSPRRQLLTSSRVLLRMQRLLWFFVTQ